MGSGGAVGGVLSNGRILVGLYGRKCNRGARILRASDMGRALGSCVHDRPAWSVHYKVPQPLPSPVLMRKTGFWPDTGRWKENPTTMKRWAIRRRLRQVYRLLTDSRAALEAASEAMRDRWMKDTLFVMACRRLIMMNLLDRELGAHMLKVKPLPGASHHFDRFLAGAANGTRWPVADLVGACQQEESYLMDELEYLRLQPGISGATRQVLTELIVEARENVNDLVFAAQTADNRG